MMKGFHLHLHRMKKVHPNTTTTNTLQLCSGQEINMVRGQQEAQVLTVWRKSLLFNCSGFTVYDGKGDLVFRVDNYGSCDSCKSEVVLMDATGKPLLSIRKKRQLNLGYHWVIYNGEDSTEPLMSVKRHSTMNKKALAEVSLTTSNGSLTAEGSYVQRSCVVQNNKGQQVAEIRRKDSSRGGAVSFGDDVFQLVVQPAHDHDHQMDTRLAMGIVIALDQMAAARPYLLRSWSS